MQMHPLMQVLSLLDFISLVVATLHVRVVSVCELPYADVKYCKMLSMRQIPRGCYIMIDWLIVYGFTSRSRIFHWRAAKFRPKLGAQCLWAGRDLYRATHAVTQDLGFSGLIRRTAPFNRLLRFARGCVGPILTRIPTACLEIWNNGIHYAPETNKLEGNLSYFMFPKLNRHIPRVDDARCLWFPWGQSI
jgi:hypothetical protein